jgi:hypothetical protein
VTEVFGEIVTPADVELAVEETLKLWMPTYLRFMERTTGHAPKSFPNVRSWRPANSIEDRFPEQQIPAVQVELGTDVTIIKRAETANAIFSGTVDFLVATTQPESARRIAGWYSFAGGLALEQHPALDGTIKVGGLAWEKMGTPAVAKPEGRWLGLGSITITVEVLDIFSSLVGPVEPQPEDSDEAPPGYPTVATHDLIELAL